LHQTKILCPWAPSCRYGCTAPHPPSLNICVCVWSPLISFKESERCLSVLATDLLEVPHLSPRGSFCYIWQVLIRYYYWTWSMLCSMSEACDQLTCAVPCFCLIRHWFLCDVHICQSLDGDWSLTYKSVLQTNKIWNDISVAGRFFWVAVLYPSKWWGGFRDILWI
jgi:hypothetical protein